MVSPSNSPSEVLRTGISIYYVGTYPPITCGIADYTRFLSRESPRGKWGVLSFDLAEYGFSSDNTPAISKDPLWYGISARDGLKASTLSHGVQRLGGSSHNSVLWFQHEMGIWPDTKQLLNMISGIDTPVVITFHTLHFQSNETPEGLRRNEVHLLDEILPKVQAVTVFSRGVYNAVIRAFPTHTSKIHMIRHGIHSFPEVSRLSRKEAREQLNDYLLYESSLDKSIKETIHRQSLFSEQDSIIIGQTGFLCPNKLSESLYVVRDRLQEMVPHRRISAVRIGSPRDEVQDVYAREFRARNGVNDRYFLELLLPPDILPLAQRAFDINFYWPKECTQSGILAHALGTGAIVAGRDLEGVGETLKESGELVDKYIDNILFKIRTVILNPDIAEAIEESALDYSTEYSWSKQVRKHYQLAEDLLSQLAPVGNTPLYQWIPPDKSNRRFALENVL
ncbi:MAG: hypothetical protein R6U89_05195 [Dehalococcoidia bacterium]